MLSPQSIVNAIMTVINIFNAFFISATQEYRHKKPPVIMSCSSSIVATVSSNGLVHVCVWNNRLVAKNKYGSATYNECSLLTYLSAYFFINTMTTLQAL